MAATKLQAIQRGKLSRKDTESKKSEKSMSTTVKENSNKGKGVVKSSKKQPIPPAQSNKGGSGRARSAKSTAKSPKTSTK